MMLVPVSLGWGSCTSTRHRYQLLTCLNEVNSGRRCPESGRLCKTRVGVQKEWWPSRKQHPIGEALSPLKEPFQPGWGVGSSKAFSSGAFKQEAGRQQGCLWTVWRGNCWKEDQCCGKAERSKRMREDEAQMGELFFSYFKMRLEVENWGVVMGKSLRAYYENSLFFFLNVFFPDDKPNTRSLDKI